MTEPKIIILTFFVICAFAANVCAAPVGAGTCVKEMKGRDLISEEFNISFFSAIEADVLNQRDLDNLEGEVEAGFYTAKLGFSTDRIDIYGIIGQARDVEYNAQVSGANLKYDLENEFAWGGGISVFIYEVFGIKLFADAKYRTIEDMDYDSVTLEGVKYSKEALTGSKKNATWEEQQVALSIAKKFEYFTPYIGLKYSDVEASAKVTIEGIVYDTGNLDAGENIGAFVGCSLTPLENLSVDVEGRFMDEEAVSVALVYTF
jgi:hypothetical protein